jgi:magnesium transporter
MLDALAAGFDKYGIDEELRRSLRDVADHVVEVNERIDGLRLLLRDILSVNSILVAQKQNEEMTSLTRTSNEQNNEVKKISAWAAIGFAPTLVGTIYGMNFTHMPELKWTVGYPLALFLMLMSSVLLYILFKRRGWI